MASMTQDQLTKHIQDTVVPLIKDTAGPIVAEAVAAQVAKAAESTTAPPWAAKLFGGQTTTEAPAREKGLGFGRIARAIAMSKMEGTGAKGVADTLKAWGDTDLSTSYGDMRAKALAAGSASAGGYLVPVQQSQEIVELRRAKTVVRGSNPRTVPLPTGTLNVPKIVTGATGGYIGENTNAPKSEQVFGQLQLSAKKLAVLVPISNDLVRNSSPAADSIVRDDIVRSLSVTEDVAFLRGDGMNGSPKGLRQWVPAANVTTSTATVTLATVTSELGTAILTLMNNNVPEGNWTWIFSPRTWKHLFTVQNTNGQFVFMPELATGKLWGFPFKMTTSVPITLTEGANSDTSEVYLVNFDDMVIGDNLNLTIDVSGEAAYHNGSTVVAAFSQDQTVIRAIAEHDFGARDANAIAVIKGVRWGV